MLSQRSEIELTLRIYGVGVALANTDTSLVVATYSSIASVFHQSAEGSWLLTAYFLGYIVALPVVCHPLCVSL